MERRSKVVCNSRLALPRHFIQRLVKQDLFCFASAVGNARRSQFVGSFIKRRTASEASRSSGKLSYFAAVQMRMGLPQPGVGSFKKQ